MAKLAVTVLSESMTIASGSSLPEASPLQPTKCQPVAGEAVSCTRVPVS